MPDDMIVPEVTVLDQLQAWDHRLALFTEELKYLLKFPIPAHASVMAVHAAVRLLESARQRIGDDVFPIMVGMTVAYATVLELDDTPKEQVIASIDDIGVIRYRSGFVDTVERLRKQLLDGSAKIYTPYSPDKSGPEQAEPGNSVS